MNSNVKAVMVATFLVLGLFTGTNYMVDKETGTDWLMWTILLLLGALLFWVWLKREEQGAEEAIEESLDAAEETLKRLETQAAPAQAPPVPKAKAPSVEPEVAAVEEPEPVVEVTAPEPVAKSSGEPDDLTQVKGIGAKSAEILTAAGIDTFAKLAGMSEDAILEIIRNGGGRKSGSMGTWVEQAKALAEN